MELDPPVESEGTGRLDRLIAWAGHDPTGLVGGDPAPSLRKPTVADWAQWCPPDQPRFLELQLLHYAPAAPTETPPRGRAAGKPLTSVQVLAVVEVAVHPAHLAVEHVVGAVPAPAATLVFDIPGLDSHEHDV
jgi:hypothetical protein